MQRQKHREWGGPDRRAETCDTRRIAPAVSTLVSRKSTRLAERLALTVLHWGTGRTVKANLSAGRINTPERFYRDVNPPPTHPPTPTQSLTLSLSLTDTHSLTHSLTRTHTTPSERRF